MKNLKLALIFTTALSGITYAQVYKLENLKISKDFSKEYIETKEFEKREIVANRGIDLGDILSNHFPDISKVRKSGIANDIFLRGFGRDNINVLLDGNRIYGACPNRMDPPISHISLSEVKEVKILEGAFDVENEGSLGGVINIISRDPTDGFSGNLDITTGSYSYRRFNTGFNIGNDFIQILVNGSMQDSKVFKSGEGKYLTEYPTGSSAYKSGKINGSFFNLKNLWTKLNININEENQLKISLGYEYLQDTLYPYLKMDAISDMTYKTNLQFINKPLGLNFSLYFNSVKHDMSDKFRLSSDKALPGYNYGMRTVAKSEVKGFKIKKDFSVNDLNIKVGLEGFRRYWLSDNEITMGKITDNRGMIPGVSIKDLGLFAEGRKTFGNIVLSLGLRYDILKSEADKNKFGLNNKNLYGRYYKSYSYKNNDYYISGNVLLKYKLDKKNSIYLGYGHSVRVPDPEERFIALDKPMSNPDWVGNPNLKAVKNDEIDAGFEYYRGLFGLKGNLFYSKLTDYIYLTDIKSLDGKSVATSYTNIDATIYGGSLTLLGYITDNVSSEFSLAYQRGKKDSGNYKDKDLAEIPPLKLRLAFKYENDLFSGEIENIYATGQKKVDTDLKETPTSSYYVLNLKGSYKINNNLQVRFGIDNLFDRLYYSHLSYLRNPFSSGVKIPEPGRFAYLNINLNF